MSKIFKIALLSGVLAGSMLTSFADRGINRKARNKVVLNVAINSSFANTLSFNLKTGLKYQGSLLNLHPDAPFSMSSLVTYQKGNVVYIMPVKQKVLVSEMRQGYTGLKLIIKAH